MNQNSLRISVVFTLLIGAALISHTLLNFSDMYNQTSYVSVTPDSTEDSSKTYLNYYKQSEESWISESKLNETYRGIIEVTRYPNSTPTQDQVERAWRLYNQTYTNAERDGWFDYQNARRSGYYMRSFGSSHYPNNKSLKDNEVLKPEKPEYLIYYEKSGGSKKFLVGVMYLTNSVNDPGEQVGGPLTEWHYHKFSRPQCLLNHNKLVYDKERCSENELYTRSPEMLHVWFIDHPEGVFATNMSIEKQVKSEQPGKLSKSEFIEVVMN